MPFKSEAQRRKFYAMESRGEIPKGTSASWEAHTPAGKLPARVRRGKRLHKHGETVFSEAFLDELEAICEKRAGLFGKPKTGWGTWTKTNVLVPVASTAVMAVIADKAIRAADALSDLMKTRAEKKKKKRKKP